MAKNENSECICGISLKTGCLIWGWLTFIGSIVMLLGIVQSYVEISSLTAEELKREVTEELKRKR